MISSQEPKVPKIYQIVNWLLSDSQEMPKDWPMFKTKLENIVPYITEQLWYLPQVTWYLNKHINGLYNIPDPIDTLILLKKIFTTQGIIKSDLFQVWPEIKPKLEEAIELADNKDQNDANAKAMLMKYFNIPFDNYIKPKVTKANVKVNSSPELKKIITDVVEKSEFLIDETNDVYLNDLNQDIIDENELILFDVSLLKKQNKVLFIFIDKNNHKKYFLKPFIAKIYISKQDGVINNDYIEKLTEDKFFGYILKDIKLYTKLKYMLNDSYKRIVNGDNPTRSA